MKFGKNTLLHIGVVTLVILTILSLTSAFRKNRFSFELKDQPINVFVNKGFSYLKADKDVFKDVELLTTKKKIFDFDLDIAKRYFADYYITEENFRTATNRNVSNFNTEEIRKTDETTLRGSYRASVGSEAYRYANSHILRKVPVSQIFADTVGRLTLSVNHNHAFPNFSPEFIEDAYKTFYMMPNANAKGANNTLADLSHDKDTIKAVIQFFTDYGTHYISEMVFGYRYGFYQEHKNKTTVIRDKDGEAPILDLPKYSFIQKADNDTSPAKKADNDTSPAKKDNGTKFSSPGAGGSSPAADDPAKDDKKPDEGKKKPTTTKDFLKEAIANINPKKEDNDTDAKNDTDSANNDTTAEPLPPVNTTDLPGSPLKTKDHNPALIVAGNSTNPDINQFYIGQCVIHNRYLKPETCNIENPRPVRMEVNPLYYLFHPLIMVKKDFSAVGKPLNREKISRIHTNMGHFFREVQKALDPTLMVVTNIETFKLSKSEASKQNCLNIKPKTMEKIFNSYKQTKSKYVYQEDLLVKNQHIPVVSLKNFGALKHQYQIVSRGEEGMFWCITRDHNMTPELLKNGKWEKRRYLTEVKLIVDHDSKTYEQAGYNCKDTWAFIDRKTKAEKRWHFCTKWIEDFTEPSIIVDVRFFDFHPKMHKCNDGFLYTISDARRYECDCDLNFGDLSDDKRQGDTFLCIARKYFVVNRPVEPNLPVASTRPKREIK